MEKIASFKVDHTKLKSGLYVSRRDQKNGVTATTFDLRVTAPNIEPVMDMPAIHAIEHIVATYLRSSDQKDDVIYFGPMGCRTGFYLIMFGELSSQDVYDLVIKSFEFVVNFSGEIPGADPVSCGNYQELNLDMAKFYAEKYLTALKQYKNLEY